VSWKDYASAAELRDIIRQIVRNVLRDERPKPRYGYVAHIDRDNFMAQVFYEDETEEEGATPQPVSMTAVQPLTTGQRVQISGPKSDREITAVYGAVFLATGSAGGSDPGVIPPDDPEDPGTGGAHPSLTAHGLMGLATKFELENHEEAANPHAVYTTDAEVDSKVATHLAAAPHNPPGSSGAPTDATYLVATAHGSLSAEVPVGATPGGELAGSGTSWSSPKVSTTHAGSAHTSFPFVFVHGTDGLAERPSGYTVVHWVGTAVPQNMGDDDLWNNPEALAAFEDFMAEVRASTQHLDTIDFQSIRSGMTRSAVAANTCAVTAQGTPNMTVAVASGTAYLASWSATGTAVTAGNVTVTTAHADNPRVDLVSVSTLDGTKTVTAGAHDPHLPLPPAIPGFHVPLALIRVPAAATAITSAMIQDKRMFLLPLPESMLLEIGDETTVITTGTKRTFRMPYAMTLNAGHAGVKASLTTASTSGVFTVDINEGGTSILSTKLTIDATEKTSATAAVAPVLSDTVLAADAEITIDVDTAGANAAGLKVWLVGTR
jgi:hypothetical protein